MLLLARVQPAGDALPQVPHLGAALHGARMTEVRAEHAPELLHTEPVAGIAEAGPQEKAGEVQPARLVRRRSLALRLECPEYVPERSDRGEWPRVAPGVERRLQAAHERDRIVAAFERGAEQSLRLGLDLGRDDHRDGVVRRRRPLRRDRITQPELEAPTMLRGAGLEP